jgi:phosphoserine phosphatase
MVSMSDSEQDAALLRLVKDRSVAKKRKAALESELAAVVGHV